MYYSYWHVFYQIEPRPEFADWLAQRVNPEVAEAVLKPVTYHSHEKDDPAWLESDRLLKVKLIFLNALRRYHQPPLPNDAEFIAVFGSLQITEALFDKWWMIRRIEAKSELGSPAEFLAYSTEPAAPTGSARVDEWLAKLRDWKGKPSILGSVLFHSPGELQISPLIHGVWPRPLLELLEESGAAGGFGNDVYDSCAAFIGWCFSKDKPPSLGVLNSPCAPWGNDSDPYEWYEKTMANVANSEHPPLLVNLDEFTITTCLGEVLWPPGKKGRERPKDPRTMRPGSPFPWGWYGVGLGDLRPAKGTYTCYPTDSLPPILATLDGSFLWLHVARSHEQRIGAISDSVLNSLLAENPRGLPREFIEFVRTPSLWQKIRSCTGCGLRLDPASTPIPGDLGRLVRFMSDYQDCIHFHLHIAPCNTKHTVVATYHFTGSEYAHLQGASLTPGISPPVPVRLRSSCTGFGSRTNCGTH